MLPILASPRLHESDKVELIGNPPFGGGAPKPVQVFAEQQFGVSTGKFEMYAYFILLTRDVLRPGGYLGLVTPNVWLTIRSYDRVRERVFSNVGLTAIAESPSAFDDAWVNTIAALGRKGVPHAEQIEIARPRILINGSVSGVSIDDPWPLRYTFRADRILPATQQLHYQVSPAEHDLLRRISTQAGKVGDIFVGTTGFQAYHNTLHTVQQIRERFLHDTVRKSTAWKRYISGTDIKAFRWSYGKNEYINYSGELYRQPESEFFRGARLVIQEIASRGERKVNAAMITEEVHSDNTTLILKPKLPIPTAVLEVLLGIFSSRFFTWFLLKTSDKPYASGDFSRMNVHDFLRTPLPAGFSEWLQSLAAIPDGASRRLTLQHKFEQLAEVVGAISNRRSGDVEQTFERLDQLVVQLYGCTDAEIGLIEQLFANDVHATNSSRAPQSRGRRRLRR